MLQTKSLFNRVTSGRQIWVFKWPMVISNSECTFYACGDNMLITHKMNIKSIIYDNIEVLFYLMWNSKCWHHTCTKPVGAHLFGDPKTKKVNVIKVRGRFTQHVTVIQP